MYIEAWSEITLLVPKRFLKDSMTKRHMTIHADLSVSTVWESGQNAQTEETDQPVHLQRMVNEMLPR